MHMQAVLLQCCWIRENKSLTAVGNEECKSSYFVEVEVLIDGFPLFREMNSVEEGKFHELSWGFCEILLGNPEKLGDFTGELWSSNWKFCSAGDMRVPDIIRLHTENMIVTL